MAGSNRMSEDRGKSLITYQPFTARSIPSSELILRRGFLSLTSECSLSDLLLRRGFVLLMSRGVLPSLGMVSSAIVGCSCVSTAPSPRDCEVISSTNIGPDDSLLSSRSKFTFKHWSYLKSLVTDFDLAMYKFLLFIHFFCYTSRQWDPISRRESIQHFTGVDFEWASVSHLSLPSGLPASVYW